MPIIRLSENTINLIAAGEVVERPASVVKELVENSIDSGANNIEIYLEQAGKNLIVVTDDGCGMSPEDMLLAVQRHTTSKLNESDISDIKFFGFRGEALPSIASVSKMSIISSKSSDNQAYQIQVANDNSSEPIETIGQKGTKTKVQDLFGQVPARLKFLKNDQRELAVCIDVVKKLALANPQISFLLKHEENIALKLPSRLNFQERIEDILGKTFSSQNLTIDFTDQDIKIFGHVAIPTYNKSSAEQQYVFVNSRPVKDKLLSTCIKLAYQDYITQGRFAPLTLFIEIPCNLIDVNVHPAKNEVRFQDANMIRSNVIRAIKNSLQQTMSSSYENLVKNIPAAAPLSYSHEPLFSATRLCETTSIPKTNYSTPHIAEAKDFDNFLNHNQNTVQNFNTKEITNFNLGQKFLTQSAQPIFLGIAHAQLHSNYIIAQNESGIVLVDQHAAHERIVYEQLKAQVQAQSLQRQKLLLPIDIEFDSNKKVQCLLEQKEYLESLALSFEKIDNLVLRILEVPRILAADNIAQIMLDIADEIAEDEQEFSLTKMIEHVLETYSCHHSIRSGQKLSLSQMNALLRQIEETPGAAQCCHGRPTYIFISLKEIEKLFKRR